MSVRPIALMARDLESGVGSLCGLLGLEVCSHRPYVSPFRFRTGLIASLGTIALLFAAASVAAGQEIFEPGDHCVAYRTIKDMFFVFDVEIIGRNCEVTASLVPSGGKGGPTVVVEVPIKSFRSRNSRRDRTVADLLGVKIQPDLRFTSSPIDADAIRADIASGHIRVTGVLTIGGRDFPLEFPLDIVEHEEKHFVAGRLATTFAAFDVHVPRVAGGFIARPHEALELVVHLELERVDGLADWAEEQGLR